MPEAEERKHDECVVLWRDYRITIGIGKNGGIVAFVRKFARRWRDWHMIASVIKQQDFLLSCLSWRCEKRLN